MSTAPIQLAHGEEPAMQVTLIRRTHGKRSPR